MQKAFQADDMETRYDCAKRYHVLYIYSAKSIAVLNVIILLLIPLCHLLSSITW